MVFALAALALTGGGALGQSGYDRPGHDYTSFQIRNGDPTVCAARCERDNRCRAWAFSYPRTDRQPATCWLKSGVPSPVERDCCISGVRGAGVIERRAREIEHSTDRVGGDYRYFEVRNDPSGVVCKAACEKDNRCRAWTYVRKGYISTMPRCYLKDEIKRPRRKPCCISGVVR